MARLAGTYAVVKPRRRSHETGPSMDYMLHLCILGFIYVGAVQALNLCIGDTGQVSFAHGALFGLGAYLSALLALRTDVPFLVALAVAVLACSLVAFLLMLACSHLRGDYFSIATFGIQLVAVAICKNAGTVTGGAVGLYGIPPAHVGAWEFASKASIAPLAGVAALVAILLCRWVRYSHLGLSLRVARENTVLTEAFGQSVVWQRCVALAASGGLAGVFGAIYAHYTAYISPEAFGFGFSLFLLSAVIVGGAGTTWGPVLGTLLLLLLPEGLRVIPAAQAHIAELRNALSALLLLGFLLWRPGGLVPGFNFTTHTQG